MKNINKIFGLLCIAYFTFSTSCSTYESDPLEWNKEEIAFDPKDSSAVNMKNLFHAIYNSLPSLHTRLSNSYLDAATDDGVPTRDGGGNGSLENYRNGNLSPENIANLDGTAWANFYKGIRRANLFLQKIEGYPSSTQLPENQIKNMKAEARALRAYFYFELIKRWGGVPIIYDEVYELEDGQWNIPRNSLDDCVKYILDEISPDSPTSCYNDLYDAMAIPPTALETVYGRMNKGAILGLISRLKLYLASPLYNENNDLKKWQEAAQAANDIMSLGIYKLYDIETKDGVKEGFKQLFIGNNVNFPNAEILMMKEASSSASLESDNSPVGYADTKARGLTSPSQNLVDAFLTIDGKTIDDPNSNYDPQDPYSNRDPRLQHTIFYNGCRWRQRAVETFVGGLDNSFRPGLIKTQTGYYLRKFLGANEESGSFASISHHYLIIRYAEILLNYAEALNESDPAGSKDKIEDCIIQIRKRAGINAGDDLRYGLPTNYTQTEMRKIIRNERRIELAFEEHRFWDIRRWKIADQDDAVMLKPVKGVIITKQADESFRYEYVDVRKSTFEPKMYWYPIPRGQMEGNPSLVQNSGWNY